MSEPTPPADVLANKQRAFLLNKFATAKNGELTPKQSESVPAWAKKLLDFTPAAAKQLVERMMVEQLLILKTGKKTDKIAITSTGREVLGTLADFVPTEPPKKEKKPRAAKAPKVIEYADRDLREAYLLDIVARAKNRTIPQADIERGVGKLPTLKELERDFPDVARLRGQGSFLLNPPATRHTLAELVGQHYLETVGTDDVTAYTLTAAGAERLKDLRQEFPVLPPLGKPTKATGAAMQEQWEAFVLLHLLNAPDQTADAGRVYAASYPKGSKLNHATAWKVRGELTAAKCVAVTGSGDTAAYSLTDAGKTRLAGLSFDAFPDVKLTGLALTALLAAARGGVKGVPTPATATPTTKPTSTAADLEAAVMEIFGRLLRERHANIRMVPIHEVRAEIRERFGERAASHEVFDELLLDLRQAKRIRMVPISDPSRVSPVEMRDSIKSSVGTLFYLETADAPSA